MKISTMMLTHAHPELTQDTAESINHWMTDRLLIVVDKAGWSTFQNINICNTKIIEGLYHAHDRSPYRNYTLGLKTLYDTWPDSDWYCYTEYDCLFTSDKFLDDLNNAWMVGCDLRRFDFKMPLLKDVLNLSKIQYSYYFLGCCHFINKDFMKTLVEMDFFNRLLLVTDSCTKGRFPGYIRHAFEEELWPTAAVALGGRLLELSCYKSEDKEWQTKRQDPAIIYKDGSNEEWRGDYKTYPIRFSPEIEEEELFSQTSIIHPSKKLDSSIRKKQKIKRRKRRTMFL